MLYKKRHMTAAKNLLLDRVSLKVACCLPDDKQFKKREIFLLLTENKPQLSIMADIQEHFKAVLDISSMP